VRTFYNGEDEWSVPLEIYGSRISPVEPYYANVQLPEKTLTGPNSFCCCRSRRYGRSNMVGWAGSPQRRSQLRRTSAGALSAAALAAGPQQITALIEQDPQISFQFGLWNRTGSQLLRGNLLVLPVGNGLLYVEPIYLQSKNNALPTLVRVVVTDGTRFRDGARSRHGPSRSWFPGRPLPPFPRRTPTGSSRRFSIRHPRLNHQPPT